MASQKLLKWLVPEMDGNRLLVGWMHQTMFTLERRKQASEYTLII